MQQTLKPTHPSRRFSQVLAYAPYLLAGVAFGIIAIRSEISSWYRIQEMFRFGSFHMYGIIGSAVLTGMVSLWLIRRLGLKDGQGRLLGVEGYGPGWRRYIYGGAIFGLGWGLVGACPGPIYALIGSGFLSVAVVLLGALLGTFTYGLLQRRLPH
jgi:uncharacterized membrane protein YedE/YeeE